MRSNIDHIKRYLEATNLSAKTLFDRFYGRDGEWLLRRYQDAAVVPLRLNNWCEERMKEVTVNKLVVHHA